MRQSILTTFIAIAVSILALSPQLANAASVSPAALKGWSIKKTFDGAEATCPASKCGSEIEGLYASQRISSLEAKWFDDPKSTYSKNIERMFKGMFGAMSFSPMKFDIQSGPKRTKIKGYNGYNADFTLTVRGTDIVIYASMLMFSDGKKVHSLGGISESRSKARQGKNAMLKAWRK